MAQKTNSLELPVSFTLRKFVDENGREVQYLQAVCSYCDETFRFKINEKDSKLFRYLLKQSGLEVE